MCICQCSGSFSSSGLRFWACSLSESGLMQTSLPSLFVITSCLLAVNLSSLCFLNTTAHKCKTHHHPHCAASGLNLLILNENHRKQQKCRVSASLSLMLALWILMKKPHIRTNTNTHIWILESESDNFIYPFGAIQLSQLSLLKTRTKEKRVRTIRPSVEHNNTKHNK